MLSTVDIIEKIIKKNPLLEEYLANDLLNLSAAARKFQPEIECELLKDIKHGAIIMALKRTKNKLQKKHISLKKLLKLGDLTVRLDLTEFSFYNSGTLIEKQKRIFEKVLKNHTVYCNFSRGVSETTLIVNSELVKQVEKQFENEKLILKLNSLSSVTIKLPAENVQTPGLYYMVLKNLAWEGINIIEIFSTSNELTLIFEQKDIERALKILKNF